MERRNFAQVLKDAKVDLNREYEKLYIIFNSKDNDGFSLRDFCERLFRELPFRGTCLSLKEFNSVHNFSFGMPPKDFDINYLVNYCEYIYNIVLHLDMRVHYSRSKFPDPTEQIEALIEKIGYMAIEENGIYKFLPKSQPVIVVSEMLPPNLSYKVIEYNHHSMKGDLTRKQATLKLLADQLEPKQKELNKVNPQFKSDLFYLLNSMNIRHNNIEPTAKEYRKAVAEMTKEELEQWYDEIYDMCLYAFMTLDQADRNAKVKQLKNIIEDNKV
jgi:hypothetical protein